MSAFSKLKFSGSTDGRSIRVALASTPGQLIHTAHASALDEIWLWAVNSDTTRRKLTIEFGGATVPDDLCEVYIEAEDGAYLVIPGWTLSNALVVRAFADAANVVCINGYVNRIT
jgi:hypothetical protein